MRYKLIISESINSVSSKDISLPSLLCIGMFVSRRTGDTKLLQKRTEHLQEITQSNSTTSAFLHFQYYLIAKNNGEIESAEKSLTKVKNILKQLKLTHWLEWLDEKHPN